MSSALTQVVELNEGAKTIQRYAFEVSLSALSAIVKSKHAGGELRGFNEVAFQMRRWSSDLSAAVGQVRRLAAARVRLASEFVRCERQLSLLVHGGSASPEADAALRTCVAEHEQSLRALSVALRRQRAETEEVLDEIAQLGLMAIVLSRGALIEAASGSLQQRAALTIASQEFANYSDRVNSAIAALRNHYGEQAK